MLRPTLSACFALVFVPSLAYAQNIGVAPVQAPPAQVAAPAPAPNAQPDRPAEDPATKSDATGFGFGISLGAMIPGGEVADHVKMSDFYGVQSSLSLTVQGYFHKNFGIVGGVRASFDASGGELCASQCRGYSFQIPILVEAAFKNRKEGFYVNAGFALATRYNVAGGGGITLTARNDGPELKLGMGYRFVLNDSRKNALSIFAGLDRGEFNYLEYSLPGDPVRSGPISHTSAHMTGELGASISFF